MRSRKTIAARFDDHLAGVRGLSQLRRADAVDGRDGGGGYARRNLSPDAERALLGAFRTWKGF